MKYGIRFARSEDLDVIKRLQEDNINVKDRSQGFLTLDTPHETLEMLNKDLGIVVAETTAAGDESEIHEVVGYYFPVRIESCVSIPLFRPFRERLLTLSYKSRRISEDNTVLGGQMCVSRQHRGGNLPKLMQDLVIENLEYGYDFLAVEVSRYNNRSLDVCQNRLGLEIIDRYESCGTDWYILAREIETKKM